MDHSISQQTLGHSRTSAQPNKFNYIYSGAYCYNFNYLLRQKFP
ncbi:unnamed protein product, partial [marine sediment metagenome]